MLLRLRTIHDIASRLQLAFMCSMFLQALREFCDEFVLKIDVFSMFARFLYNNVQEEEEELFP